MSTELHPPPAEPALPAYIDRDSGFSHKEWVILGVTSLGHSLCHLGELIFPAVMVALLTEFDLERNHVTMMVLLGYILMGVGALPVGWWNDRWDPWKVHLVYCVLMVASCLGVAASQDKEMLFVSLTLLGIATSLYHPTALAMISVGIRSRGLAMGINGVAGSVGVALAPLIGQWAVALGNWRWAYGFVAFWAVVAGLGMLLTWKHRFHKDHAHEMAAARRGAVRPVLVSWQTQAILLGAMVLGGINYRCLVTALPTFLSGETSEAGQLIRGGVFASVVMLAGCIGQIMGGRFGDRFGSRTVYLTCVLSLVPLAAGLSFLGGTFGGVIVASGLSICLFAQQPLENSLMAENTSLARRALSYGWKFALTFGVGALGAQIVGEVWEATGSLAPVFYLLAGSAACMVLLLLIFLNREAREKGSTLGEA